ncbi:MAG TPA: hypothetical protein VK357_04850 [Rubrobacteraceae bacterium]|nr:hypothetical protein [Rubrobacteraceae bacterium]
MTERVDERESGGFFLNISQKPFHTLPNHLYFRENHPVFFYEPFDQWFVSGTPLTPPCSTTPGSAPTG